MPLQNRMLPNGEIVAQSWRGSFMGNRGGRIHNPETRTLLNRRSASRRWICCVLEFKNRQRTVMGAGYTEVFFMDEVSALTAGHRPCFECRRKDAVAFQEAWQKAYNLDFKAGADEMDKRLHQERMAAPPTITHDELATLPNGVMIRSNNAYYAKKDSRFLKWGSNGYTLDANLMGEIELLAPQSVISVLSAGYEPEFHHTANILEGQNGGS